MARTNKNVSMTFEEMSKRFPDAKVKKTEDLNHRSYISDVKIPKNCTLLRKAMSSKGEITSITFSAGSKTYTCSN